MSHTYMKFYENEYRTLELTIRDNEENDFIPTTATCKIEDSSGETIVDDTSCLIYDNKVRVIVPSIVTNTKGLYNVIWTIIRSNYTYKHKTILNVEELS